MSLKSGYAYYFLAWPSILISRWYMMHFPGRREKWRSLPTHQVASTVKSNVETWFDWIFKIIFIYSIFLCVWLFVCLSVFTTCLPGARRSKKRVLGPWIGDGILRKETWDDRASQGWRQVVPMQCMYAFWFFPLPTKSEGFKLGVSTLGTLSNHFPKAPLLLFLFFFSQYQTIYKDKFIID